MPAAYALPVSDRSKRVLNVIGIVRIAMLAGREALIQEGDVKDARIHQLESDLAMLREELRLVGARMQRIAPHRRPQYTMVERMAILELRAMRGWNKTETARHFFVSDDTIRAWLGRIDDDSLIQTRTPVNILPRFGAVGKHGNDWRSRTLPPNNQRRSYL